ncbi:hypothetical protein [Sulfurimonas sp.]|uniref:hypothetical protein n=1 Tax=Sulfurimonas sp. TaxID=2022749 RepID=UPI0025E70368|nr:hypothetical protein [Sulfurimonas sp.]
MSCTIKEKVSSSFKELDLLKKHFDFVEVEKYDKYHLLTLKDKAKKDNYDWIVWLQLKIAYSDTNSCAKTSNDKLQGACNNVLDWIDILKNFEKSDEGKQLSLFEEENEEFLEKEPISPQGGEDNSWGKYFRECNRVRKSNLMKQYSFFELFNDNSAWWSYNDNDFIPLLPKSNEEMIELVKDAIVRGTNSEEGHGRFDDYWWDDEYNYITRDGALSDIELLSRVLGQVRLYLVPYKKYFYVYTDDSYTNHCNIEREGRTDYRFWFDGRKIHGDSWYKREMPVYDLNNPDFMLWLREYFNVTYKEVISDEDILKENLNGLFQRVLPESFDFLSEIKNAKNFKVFKARMNANATLGNGGGSNFSIDGFSGSYSLYKGRKGDVLTIEQNIEHRIALNRNIEGLEKSSCRDSSVYVYKLNFDEALEKVYELMKVETIRQTTMFDFIDAA